MKINSVELENYRVHKSAKFEFGNGINLILGKNGAGKSSVLEALGMALFGADSRTSDKEAVRNGEKSSTITVEITGNDGIDYLIEKKIGSSSSHRVYPKDSKAEAVTGTEAVLAKVAEISGIEKNSKKIYQNVITAYQNKIVNIFSDRPKERETLFNEIFDTAIYREMYQGYLKTALDRYTIEKKVLENELLSISSSINNIEDLEKEIKEKKEQEIIKSKKYNEVKDKLEVIEKEIKILEEAKRNFERLEREIEDRKRMILENENGIAKSEEGIKRAEESVKIVRESEEDFKNYTLIEKEIAENELEISAKESVKKEIEKAEKRAEEEKRKTVEISTLKSEKSEKLKELKELIEKNKMQLEEKMKNQKEIQEKLKHLNIIAAEKSEELKKSEEYLSLYEKTEKELSEILNKIKIMEESICNSEEMEKEKNSIESSLKELKEKLDIKKAIEGSIKEYEIKIGELSKAEEKLSGGNCPYLKEQCLNISGKSSFSDYFKIRIEEIEKKRREKESEISKFIEIDREYEAKNGEKAVLIQKKESIEKTGLELKELKVKIELGAERKENILLKASAEIKKDKKIENYEELKETSKNINIEKISTLKEVEEKERREKEIQTEITLLKEEEKKEKAREESLQKELENLEEEEKNSLKLIGIADQFIKEKSEKTADLDSLKIKTGELKNKREEVKKGYELYNSNIKTAMSLKELQKNREELTISRDNKLKEISEKESNKKKIESEFKFDKIEELYLEKNSVKESKDITGTELNSCKIEIAKLEEQAEENRRKEENLKDRKKKVKKIEKKIEIMQKFRDNINTMGKAVAAGLLSSIEKIATENFRRMTGRSEEINWINGEKESYAVYLKGEERGNTRFEVLSGGEQVAVALSIRAAMASTMTNANFAIFDEPTINLDKIRKEALSESLKEILKDLEQAIIVTHDDLFEEMAERIIIIE